MKINQELTSKAFAVVEAYAKEHKYDLVVDKNDKVRGPILFGAQSADITDQVLKTVNK
jgi:Skp family chaperone for outer membrane proteins